VIILSKMISGQNDFDKNNLAQAFKSALAIEMLESQALRALVLAISFSIGSVVILLVAYILYIKHGWDSSRVPITVAIIISSLMLFEFGMRKAIRRHIQRGTTVPIWIWYISASIEISALSTIMLFIQSGFASPVYVLSTPPLLAYCLFIVLSTLHLNIRLSLFTGSLAAFQYLVIITLTFSVLHPDNVSDAVFLTPSIYIAKVMVLLMIGVGAAFVTRELTRRQIASLRAIEAQNREQQANLQKSQFLADMSHEIRTPLNAVIGYAQLLETDASITSDQRKAVEAIRIGGRHLLAVVNDVLDISKIEAGGEKFTIASFNLITMLQELTSIFAGQCNEKKLMWIFENTVDIAEVAGDEAKLRQTLTNLLGNAVKFTESGQVALRVLAEDGDKISFIVEDTGPGISADQQTNIFNPFTQDIRSGKSSGTGLGLAIAQRYVVLMGGELTVNTMPSDGAHFQFTIPLSSNGIHNVVADIATSRQIVRHASGQTVHALVADDVAENRDVLSQMLLRFGVSVVVAVNGVEALEIIEHKPIDIAFLDIHMPELTGTEVARRVIERGQSDLKLVAVSASALSHQQTEYLNVGFDEFIEKPIQMGKVLSCLQKMHGVKLTTTPIPEELEKSNNVVKQLILPDNLINAVIKAAESNNITELKRSFVAMENLGADERAFVISLREYADRYDMDAIVLALKENMDE